MILIQCTDSKRDEPALAQHLYDESTLFNAMRRYAESTGERWAILSAKHGLVEPHEELAPYNEFGLSETQAETIAEELASLGIREVQIIAGKKYTEPLIPELERYGIDVIEICAGLSIGERVSKLQDLARENENYTLC